MYQAEKIKNNYYIGGIMKKEKDKNLNFYEVKDLNDLVKFF